jgi:hemoglobin-like flavoprotein
MKSTAPILVLDTPRTFSHLFGKFFDAHPDLDYYYRPYFQVALNTSQELAEGIKTYFPSECADGNESLATASQMTKDLKGTPAQATEDLLRRWSIAEQQVRVAMNELNNTG